MKRLMTIALTSVFLATAGAWAADTGMTIKSENQTVNRGGMQISFKGPEPFFTGHVKVDMLFSPTAELPASGAYVSFEPGARSAWHTHPAGQTLFVISGIGLTQEWGGPILEIQAGDVVRCPVGVKHWHGAAPGSAMTHLAITGDVNGKNVDWMEKVSDEQYRARQAMSVQLFL